VPLPLILSGPILRRVEPKLVAVQVTLSQACTVRLSLWEQQLKTSDATDDNLWFRSPDPGASSIRIGDQLHVCVVTVRLPDAKALVPERLYSYDIELTPQNTTTKQTLKSLGLLANDPANADPDGANTKRLALGYEVDLLPCLALPPTELTDLRVVHGSCRDTDTAFPDGLAWVDDLLSRDQAYTSPLARPHQLFLTGDQIYADEVPAPLLAMLNDLGRTLVGGEQLPIVTQQEPLETASFEADKLHFPPRHRHNLVVNEGGMTTTAGGSHLLSFAEFCAMYVLVWNNEVWPDFPPFETTQSDGSTLRTFELPADWTTQVGATLANAITKRANGDVVVVGEYALESYQDDVARLTELKRTLPKVRRALANVPTYMIFDDHEITDDWFLNPTWRDRVLGAPLGNAVIRNGMLSYALFQGWGNDPVKFEPVSGATEKQPHEQLLEQATKFLPAGATTAPNADAAHQVEILLGLNLRNTVDELTGAYAETNPPLKWHYTVPGQKHDVIVLDCRTRRSFVSRVSPPGNIGLTAMAEQIPATPPGTKKDVYLVVASLPVIGPPIFDELFAPLLFKVFDFKKEGDLQKDRGTKRMPGTNPDAEEAWCFDPKLFEALLKRLVPYSPVVFLSGDVHYSASNAMSYWTQSATEPARFVQFISSGFKNIMPDAIRFVSRTFAVAQRMARAGVGAERLGWNSSGDVLTIPANANISPKLTGALRKSPILIPTTGWRGATVKVAPDWSWRVAPLRDVRAEVDRPVLTRPDTLFPDDPAKTNDDIGAALNYEQYHRTAERHARQFEKLRNSRQVLFASSLGVVTFQTRAETDTDGTTPIGDVSYAIHDLYTAVKDPADLTTPPTPLLYARHEAPLRDAWQSRPDIQPPKAV
jgi:hypothetical protein